MSTTPRFRTSEVEGGTSRSDPQTSKTTQHRRVPNCYSLRLLEERVVNAVREDYCDECIVQTGDSAVIRRPSPLWDIRQYR